MTPALPVQSVEFTTTHWSVVLAAGAELTADAGRALETLCRIYWAPLYAFVRRQGYGPEDAQDLTQAFFARFLENHHVRLADREKGRFRTFLLSSLKNYLINEWSRAQTGKRGGGWTILSTDRAEAEGQFVAGAADHLSPDKLFERRWASALLEQVLSRLERELAGDGKSSLFLALKHSIMGESNLESYAQIAGRLGMTEGAVKVAAHRLRERYRELLREEVAHTVSSPSEVDDELRHLILVLRT